MEYNLKQRCTDYNEKAIKDIGKELKISKKFAEILYYRGIKTPEEAFDFLNPSIKRLNSPFLFRDMNRAVKLIKDHIAERSKICIYGDYDVDGVSGSAILYKCLKSLHAEVDCILPSRDEHGYGLSTEAVDKIADYNLLITVDCGITNVNEIKLAKDLGLDVIVTDHHECPQILPPADCVINPKAKDETYPFKYLCGAGVAFKLSEALIGKKAYSYMDVAATATIADMVPLVVENRIIAKFGIERLNSDPNMGLSCLIKRVLPKNKYIDSQNIAYMLAPRINAAGRIAKSDAAFNLLIAEEAKTAGRLADELCRLNEERQKRQEKVIKEATALEQKYPSDRIIIHGSDKWDVGIIGLGASKLAEKYNKPAVLFGKSGEFWTGSARSIDGVNILDVLRTREDLYEKFGGHAGAAGLTVSGNYIEKIKESADKYLNENFDESVFIPTKYYDIKLKLSDLTSELTEEFKRLEPYGFGNKPVAVLFEDVHIKNVKPIGNNKHARFTVTQDGVSEDAVIFRVIAADLPEKADLIGTVEINDFSGKPQIVADALSYPLTPPQLFEQSREYVRSGSDSKTPETYYLPRERMGEIYSLLKIISDKNYSFKNEEDFIDYIKKHIFWVNEYNLAFAVEVFAELDLIAYIKNDKISIKINKNRCSLDQSAIYKKYKYGVKSK